VHTRGSKVVIEVFDSQDKGKDVVESDSEEDTQLGLVWGSPGIAETQLPDSDEDDDNIPFSQLKEKRKEDKPQPLEYVGDIMEVYEKASRERLAYHGFIGEAIVDTLNDNNEQAYRQLDKVL
jgi:hypothetical protein